MITEAFFEIFRYLFLSLLFFFPEGPSLPETLTTTWANLLDYAGQFNNIFPVNEMLLVLVFLISFEIAMLTFTGMFWLLKFIRGSG